MMEKLGFFEKNAFDKFYLKCDKIVICTAITPNFWRVCWMCDESIQIEKIEFWLILGSFLHKMHGDMSFFSADSGRAL